jgi:hypothetical protein
MRTRLPGGNRRGGALPVLVAAALAVACSGPRPEAAPSPPRAEFLLSAGDSSFWVTSVTGKLHARGAPIVLAEWDGRLHEVYVTDDDRSFQDALFLGQRMYQRDLATGDSLLVFTDTVVPRAARDYAEANPNARPLGPDEEENENPPVSVSSELDVLDIYGPFVSYEYHLDVDTPQEGSWHSTHRGVIDLRTGKAQSAIDLFGAQEGARIVAQARAAYRATLDSVRGANDESAGRARRSLSSFHFDPTSFSLIDEDREPWLDYVAPGRGEGPSGLTLPLPSVHAKAPEWWRELASTLPAVGDSGVVTWSHSGFRVIARYDTSGEVARVAITDSAGRRWDVARVTGPVRNVLWFDEPRIDSTQRQGLARAFEEAVLYDERTRTADRPSPTQRAPHRLASRRAPTLYRFAARATSTRRHAR